MSVSEDKSTESQCINPAVSEIHYEMLNFAGIIIILAEQYSSIVKTRFICNGTKWFEYENQ